MNPKLVQKYFPLVKEISSKYQYDSNITHLLYLIIPAFITKYSLAKERLILTTFQNTKILISPKTSKTIEAYYTSIPSYQNNTIITTKYIIIQNYQNISLVQLLDNLVHEFNHAINSYQQETFIQENILYLRTGLTYSSYSLPNLTPLKKEPTYILEEILNTHQTEEIINLIKSYHDKENNSLANTIYAINSETTTNYTSKSYYLENRLFQKILENKTFLSTLNNLRLSGDIKDIEYWFNNITNQPNSYQNLNNYLFQMMQLEQTLSTKKYFKNKIINQIKTLIEKINNIITTFNQNCTYK